MWRYAASSTVEAQLVRKLCVLDVMRCAGLDRDMVLTVQQQKRSSLSLMLFPPQELSCSATRGQSLPSWFRPLTINGQDLVIRPNQRPEWPEVISSSYQEAPQQGSDEREEHLTKGAKLA